MNELIQIGPISPLRQRLIDDMTMHRFSNETQRNYLRDVGRFATWPGRSPHTACTEDIRQFQIEQQQAGVPAPTMNSTVGALRFFFTHTLDRPDLARKLIRTKQVRKIPVVLTMAEVKRLLDATRSLTAPLFLLHSSAAPVPIISSHPAPQPGTLVPPPPPRHPNTHPGLTASRRGPRAPITPNSDAFTVRRQFPCIVDRTHILQ